MGKKGKKQGGVSFCGHGEEFLGRGGGRGRVEWRVEGGGWERVGRTWRGQEQTDA
jgi:hypothetical protein